MEEDIIKQAGFIEVSDNKYIAANMLGSYIVLERNSKISNIFTIKFLENEEFGIWKAFHIPETLEELVKILNYLNIVLNKEMTIQQAGYLIDRYK